MTTQEEGEEVVAEIIADLKSTVLDKCYEQYIEKQVRDLMKKIDWHPV